MTRIFFKIKTYTDINMLKCNDFKLGRKYKNKTKKAQITDLIAIATLCILTGSPKAAQVHHLTLSCVQLCGRGTETACIDNHNIEMKHVPNIDPTASMEDTSNCVLVASVNRPKTHTDSDNMHLLPHRDGFMLCYAWSRAACLLLNEPDRYTFPELRKAANLGSSKKTSAVPQRYKQEIERLIMTFMENTKEDSGNDLFQQTMNLNSDLTIHGLKVSGVNIAASSGNLDRQVGARAGWEMANMSTFHDYYESSVLDDLVVARSLSGWKCKCSDGEVGGGFPPRFHGVKDLEEKVPMLMHFVQLLFFKYSDEEDYGVKIDQQCYLTAILFLHIQDLVAMLGRHPTKKYGTSTKDIFSSYRLLQLMATAAKRIPDEFEELTIEGLLEVGKHVRRDFIQRNILFVNAKQRQQALGDKGELIDERSLATFMRTVADQSGLTSVQISDIRSVLSKQNVDTATLTGNVEKLYRKVDKMASDLGDISAKLGVLSHLLEGRAIPLGEGELNVATSKIQNNMITNGNASEETHVVSQEDVAFPPGFEKLEGRIALKEVVNWYIYDRDRLYRGMDKGPRKNKLSTTVSKIRKCHSVLLLFCKSYVPAISDGTTPQDVSNSEWHRDVKITFKDALQRLREFVVLKIKNVKVHTAVTDEITVVNFIKFSTEHLFSESCGGVYEELQDGPIDGGTFVFDEKAVIKSKGGLLIKKKSKNKRKQTDSNKSRKR